MDDMHGFDDERWSEETGFSIIDTNVLHLPMSIGAFRLCLTGFSQINSYILLG